ncbi:MAG: polysaccharide pyruvyl transferase family protein, partial [Clostridiales bacterium]
MSKNILICQHGGSSNHGCEALARTVISQMRQIAPGCQINLYSYSRQDDQKYLTNIQGLSITGLKQLPGKYSPTNISYHIHRIIKPETASKLPITKQFKSLVNQADLVIAIGGDNYCYNKGRGYYALDQYIKSQGKKYVLLGCSIEPDDLSGELSRHLQLFDMISAREHITYQALLNHGLTNCVYAPDSAFLLAVAKNELPPGFKPKQAVGINLSPLIIKNEPAPGLTMANYRQLIRYLLEETSMQIALIPHVVQKGNDDRTVLRQLYQEFAHTQRLFLIEDADARMLKDVIGNLRFFVGARTHATIAAYSSAVPTLVVGYSVKAKGIATDLFGDYHNYVLPVQQLTDELQLTKSFCALIEQEEVLRQTLQNRLPTYQNQAKAGFNNIRKLLDGEPLPASPPFTRLTAPALCCGCGLCAVSCPIGCISIKTNHEGFPYPQISETDCTHCGICASNCPVNTARTNHSEPVAAFAAAAKDEQLLTQSSSGGLFTLLATQILAQGGMVAGAAFDQNFQLHHILIDTVADLARLRGSKYLQSDITDCYQLIGDALAENKPILFCGTPCQTAALRNCFSEANHLYLVSVICHGVPSPNVFQQYLQELQIKLGSAITAINFRDKTLGWQQFSFTATAENGQTYRALHSEDSFMKLFLGNACLRSSCHNCFA